MHEDSVMQEVHRIKDEIAARYNYDVRALAKALREAQEKGGRKVVHREPKRIASQPPSSAKAE